MDTRPRPERTIEVPNPVARPRVDLILLGLLIGAAAAVLAMSWSASLSIPQSLGAVGLPAAVLFLVIAGKFVRRERTQLRRVGDHVLGTRAPSLPAGIGRVVVERIAHRIGDNTAFFYTMRYENGGAPAILVERAFQPSQVRAYAEGLCRLGGYQMVWKGPEGDEVRTVSELDAPLVERLAAGQDADDGHIRAEPAKVLPLAGDAVEVPGTPVPPGRALAFVFLIVGAGVLEGMCQLPLPGDSIPRDVAIATAIAAAVGVLFFVLIRTIRPAIVIDGLGIHLQSQVLGAVLHEQVLSLDTLESIYVEESYVFQRLIFAGDGFYRSGGRFGTLASAIAARRAVVAALGGRPPAASDPSR